MTFRQRLLGSISPLAHMIAFIEPFNGRLVVMNNKERLVDRLSEMSYAWTDGKYGAVK